MPKVTFFRKVKIPKCIEFEPFQNIHVFPMIGYKAYATFLCYTPDNLDTKYLAMSKLRVYKYPATGGPPLKFSRLPAEEYNFIIQTIMANTSKDVRKRYLKLKRVK